MNETQSDCLLNMLEPALDQQGIERVTPDSLNENQQDFLLNRTRILGVGVDFSFDERVENQPRSTQFQIGSRRGTRRPNDASDHLTEND